MRNVAKPLINHLYKHFGTILYVCMYAHAHVCIGFLSSIHTKNHDKISVLNPCVCVCITPGYMYNTHPLVGLSSPKAIHVCIILLFVFLKFSYLFSFYLLLT